MNWIPVNWSVLVWRIFFFISACWNFLGGINGIVRPAKNLKKYYNVQSESYITIFLNRSFWIVVLIFGIGYLLVGIDPTLFYGIVVMGIIGKIAVAINWIYIFIIKKSERIVLLGAIGDLIFTVFFVLFLFSEVTQA